MILKDLRNPGQKPENKPEIISETEKEEFVLSEKIPEIDTAEREDTSRVEALAKRRKELAPYSARISCGSEHTVGVKTDGTVVATGYNFSGQCNVSDWQDIVAISAGGNHTVGLKADGTVVAVGNNDWGQCDVSGWRDIVAISAGKAHTVGLKSDGTVVAAGKNDCGRCDVGSWRDIVAISAGYNHTVGLKSDGTVVAAGSNYSGKCNVGSWRDIVAISAGDEHTVGLKSDGTVVDAGRNYYGLCNVDSWRDIVAISAGPRHTVGLKSDGTVVATGWWQFAVRGWRDIVAISAGRAHTVGLKSDGTVLTVDNDGGWMLCLPDRREPILNANDTKLEYCLQLDDNSLRRALYSSLFCDLCDSDNLRGDADGILFVCKRCGWQRSLSRTMDLTFYKLSDLYLDKIDRRSRLQLQLVNKCLLKLGFLLLEDKEWRKARVFFNHVLKCDAQCGEAFLGELMAELHVRNRSSLGDCSESFAERESYQKAIRFGSAELRRELAEAYERFSQSQQERLKRRTELTHFSRMVCCGRNHTVGLKSDGTVVAVGNNDEGQCNVSGWSDIVAISTRGSHTAGLRSDGTVVAAGNNDHGQCNVGDWQNIAAISAGLWHTAGLKSDGTVVAVGCNDHGQCDVSDWSDIVAISAGKYNTIGLKADGTVVAVGCNDDGQCNVRDWSDIVAVSAGDAHTVGLKKNGTVEAVGNKASGCYKVRNWRGIIAISAGRKHTVGVKSDGTIVTSGKKNIFEGWQDIVAVSVGDSCTVGLKSDGTVVATGWNQNGRRDVSDWKLFENCESISESEKNPGCVGSGN